MKEVIKGFTNQNLRYKIDDEGLDYFFIYYLSSSAINDEELKMLVNKFATAREKIINRLVTLGVGSEDDF